MQPNAEVGSLFLVLAGKNSTRLLHLSLPQYSGFKKLRLSRAFRSIGLWRQQCLQATA